MKKTRQERESLREICFQSACSWARLSDWQTDWCSAVGSTGGNCNRNFLLEHCQNYNHKRIKKKIKKEKNNAEEIGEVNFISILIETRVTILRLREVLKLQNHFSLFFFTFGENVFIASSGDEVNKWWYDVKESEYAIAGGILGQTQCWDSFVKCKMRDVFQVSKWQQRGDLNSYAEGS